MTRPASTPGGSDAWLRLAAAAAGGGRAWHAAVRAAGGADKLLGMTDAERRSLGLDVRSRQRLNAPDTEAEACWRDWLGQDCHDLVTIDSARYPARLAQLDDAPLALWTVGARIETLNGPQLAIVGSRNPTAGGRLTARAFAQRVSGYGLTVTSGLAVGIDSAGHEGALGSAGSTIAVLGSGIDEVYPRSNSKLAERIAAEGLIVSEYPPGTPPRAGQFPRRNRIIAGLALGTLVVEAARQSGSLITARLAAEHGREVFAIPGSIHSALSKGCHALLRDGAKLVEDIGDILIEIAPGIVVELDDAGATESRSAPDELTGARRKLAETLDFSPVTIDELAGCTGLTPAELSSMLLHLEMEGAVEALPGGRYSRLMKRT